MKNDLATVIRRVGSFLGSPVSEDNIPTLVDHLSFDKMKKNTAVNKEDFVEVHTYKSKICNIDFFPILYASGYRLHLLCWVFSGFTSKF